MDSKVILGVTGLAVALLSLALLLPDRSNNQPETLPWNITHPGPDTTRVLGITLGSDTLKQAEQAVHEFTVVSMFRTPDGALAVEAYFEELNLNGLKAKVVLTVALDQATLQSMFERGLRMNATGSGKRITLTTEDLAIVRQSTVTSLSYLPNIKLEEAVLVKRFGMPAEKIREKKSGTVHWLYPQHGLDISMREGEKPLLQYVTPGTFSKLREPLLGSGGDVIKP